MRRFIAYLVMMLTLVCALLFNTQAMLSNKVDAMEFDQGTQLVYSLSKRNIDDYDKDLYPNLGTSANLYDIDIEDKVMKRLKEAGVRDADVKIIQGKEHTNDGYQLKVTLAPLSDTDLSNVKRILAKSGELLIGAKNDTVFSQSQTGDNRIFADTVAEIVYVSNKAYPAINFYDANAYDKLKKTVTEAESSDSSDKKDNADDSSKKTESTIAYLWMNKTKQDTYAKAYGTNDTVVDDDTKGKVLAQVDLSNYNTEKHQVRIASDLDGKEFTPSSARAFVTMLNAADYGFNIRYLYENKVIAGFGINGLKKAYIVFGIVLAVLSILAVLLYGLSGLTSAVTLLFSVFVSFLLASLLGFEFSVSFLSGLAVIAFLSLLISGNYFERVKRELKKGSDLKKANRDGYNRAWFVSLDIAIISLATSIFSFLVSSGSLKTFFGVVMIGTVFTFVLTNYFDKWITYWLTNAENSHLRYFSLFRLNKERKTPAFVRKNAKSDKFVLVGVPVIIAALLAVMLPVRNTLNQGQSFFTNRGDYASDYTLNITFEHTDYAYAPLSSKQNYLLYLQGIGKLNGTDTSGFSVVSAEEKQSGTIESGFVYFPKTATVNVVEKKDSSNKTYFIHYFSVEIDRDLNLTYTANKSQISEVIKSAIMDQEVKIDTVDKPIAPKSSSHFKSNSLEVQSYVTHPTHINYNTNNFFLVVFLISVFGMIYVFLRYGLNLALTQLAFGTLLAGLGVALLCLLPIPYNSFTVFGVLLPVFLANVVCVPLLAINKETIKSRGLKKTVTIDQREEIMNEVSSQPLSYVLFALCSVLLCVLPFFLLSSDLLGLGISFILTFVLGIVLFWLFAYRFYFFLTTHITFRKLREKYEAHKEKVRLRKHEAKPVAASDGYIYVDQDISHETIIPGMNDFRR